MLILNMNSKRQRRPNVRLREVGDIPAAFACGTTQKTVANLGNKRCKQDFLIHEGLEIGPVRGSSQLRSSEAIVSDPCGSLRLSVERQLNRENMDPDCLRSNLEFGNLDKTDVKMSKLNFGTITRKCRLMNRRRWSTNGKYSVFTDAWYPKITHDISSGCGEKNGLKEVDIRPISDFKHSLSQESLATGKEACEYDSSGSTFNEQMQRNPNGFWKEGSCSEGNNCFPHPTSAFVRIGRGHNYVYSVSTWLEELGFGKYSDVFKTHEVDEQALPLLTFEDLKEMGVLPVGHRRKLYNAIKQLKESGERVCG
ncbi:hypothetical protein NMG60_11005821 [Bertholletia excelsa]